MTDVFTPSKRSSVMAAIRSTGNKDTELRLMRLFRSNGINGWRRRYPLFGKPDFTFPAARLAVFVDGCFWHGCPTHGRTPGSNREYWEAKLARNRLRDKAVVRYLRASGWRVLRVWEHALKDEERLIRRIRRALES